MNIVHLISWIGKYYLEIQIVGRTGRGRMAHQCRRLFAPTGSISWGVHSLSDPHSWSFHGSSCMVTDWLVSQFVVSRSPHVLFRNGNSNWKLFCNMDVAYLLS